MCQFLSILVAEKDVQHVSNFNGHPLLIYENTSLSAQVSKGFVFGRATSHVCDCGRFYTFNPSKIDKLEDKEIDKLVKKGWSAQKIERYKADRQKNIQKKENNKTIGVMEKDWFNYFEKLLSSPDVKFVGFLAHFYKHSVETERIKLKEIVNVRFTNIDESFFGSIEDGKLYIFEKTGSK